MSFSVTYVGKPEAIKNKLADYTHQLSGQSRNEFESVKPALDTILDQNVGNGAVVLNASGHASFNAEGEKTSGQCSVSVSTIGILAE